MMKIFNLFKKRQIIHIVLSDLSYVKKNIQLQRIPLIGEKIYFTEDETYNVMTVITYGGKPEVIWVIVEKESGETKLTVTLPDDSIFIEKEKND